MLAGGMILYNLPPFPNPIKKEDIMPFLQVRELPENIYHLLQKRAKAENRSLAQEAVSILAKGLGLNTAISNKSRRADLLLEIEKKSLPKTLKQFNPVGLIREDRER
jgi:plasmid stability protein